MSLADLIIPEWAKWAAIAAASALVFGGGYRAGVWYATHKSAAAVTAAKLETAELRASVSQAAARQAEVAVQAAARQINTVQEVTRDSTTRARALDQRIAAGGLRYPSPNPGGAIRLPAIASHPGAPADAAAQPVSAGAERAACDVQPDLDPALRQAALDAQQLAEIINAACLQGMCPDQSGQ